MKKVLAMVTFLGMSSISYGVEVGDKVQITKLTVMCEKYTSEINKYYLKNLLSENYPIKKSSKNNCMHLNAEPKDNVIGIVIKKAKGSLPKNYMDVLAKEMRFENLKIDLVSVAGTKSPRGHDIYWFAFPKDVESYKVIK